MSFVFYFVVKGPSTIGKATDNCVCVGWREAGVSANTMARRVLIHVGQEGSPFTMTQYQVLVPTSRV